MPAITRTMERDIVRVDLTDTGDITLEVIGMPFSASRDLTPNQARSLAILLTNAADEATDYLAELATGKAQA